MPIRSAGILLYRNRNHASEVFLVHPGGPFWQAKDDGVWSIPKGEYEHFHDPLAAARREFEEETGSPPPAGDLVPLGEVRLVSGKIVSAWALEGDIDAAAIRSNTFELEWPPRSGRMQSFPEVDRAAWFTLVEARTKLHPAQHAFLERLQSIVAAP